MLIIRHTGMDDVTVYLNLLPATDPSAAYSVRLHEDTILNDSPVIFGTVDLNVGDGYDEFTGLFSILNCVKRVFALLIGKAIFHILAIPTW